MSTGCKWEGIRQVRATLLGARHVPERLCGGRVFLGRYIKCSTFYSTLFYSFDSLTRCQLFPILSLLVAQPSSELAAEHFTTTCRVAEAYYNGPTL